VEEEKSPKQMEKEDLKKVQTSTKVEKPQSEPISPPAPDVSKM
jgi:hypothetical protein